MKRLRLKASTVVVLRSTVDVVGSVLLVLLLQALSASTIPCPGLGSRGEGAGGGRRRGCLCGTV